MVVLLLALEVFLLLSERFEWFAFSRHRIWSVLIAATAIGGAMLLISCWFLLGLIFKWRFQFSIRALLLLTVVVALPCGWLAAAREQARKQREAVEEFEDGSGTVSYDYQFDLWGHAIPGATPPGPAWLRKVLGDDLFVNVTQVNFVRPGGSGTQLKQLEELTKLRRLDSTKLTSTTPDWNTSKD